MAGQLDVFDAVFFTLNGAPANPASGSRDVPAISLPLTDGRSSRYIPILVPAGGIVTAWKWADTKEFSLIKVQPRDGASCWMGVRASARTSATDKTPTGNNVGWFNQALEGPERITSTSRYTDSTAANIVTETGGAPTVRASGSKVLSTVDLIQFWNEQTSDVWVDVWVWAK